MIEFTITRSVRSWKQVPKNATILSVNGLPYLGYCEVCGQAITAEDSAFSDSDSVMWHRTCPSPSKRTRPYPTRRRKA
jgi:hypothetical protein